MDSRFNNPFVSEQEDPFSMPEGSDSPPFSGAANDGKLSNTALSPKRSRRAIQKRVVSVPIGDAEGSRLKGEGAPPSDSWAWRKYGQKPIKGSPYPRGYYRCSSSKGCPARKQVERSRVDPTMLVITYACEHNHPWPTSKNSNTNSTNSTSTAATSTNNAATAATTLATASTDNSLPEEQAVFSNQPEIEAHDTQFADLGDESLIAGEDFTWFSDVRSSSPTILESPLCGVSGNEDIDVFPMGEEDESLFADLGELPECSLVFRRVFMEQEEERRRCSIRAASWCESTG